MQKDNKVGTRPDFKKMFSVKISIHLSDSVFSFGRLSTDVPIRIVTFSAGVFNCIKEDEFGSIHYYSCQFFSVHSMKLKNRFICTQNQDSSDQ